MRTGPANSSRCSVHSAVARVWAPKETLSTMVPVPDQYRRSVTSEPVPCPSPSGYSVTGAEPGFGKSAYGVGASRSAPSRTIQTRGSASTPLSTP